MNVSELTEGFLFYDASKFDFTWYEYLRPMPVKNPVNLGRYHIVINKKFDKAETIYIDDLQRILNKKLFSLRDAINHQIELVEHYLKMLKDERSEGR